MKHSFDTTPTLDDFTGSAPLFPLPNCVQFPRMLLPLHIFEPRYRRMVADALAGNRLIAMALLKPESETATAHSAPDIHNTVCLGRITAEELLSDGRYQLVLDGVSRARILSEEETNGRPYRSARLELCADICPAKPTIDRERRQSELISGFAELFPHSQFDELYHQMLDDDVPLGILSDVLASAMRLPPREAQEILSELNVDLRSDLVLQRLRDCALQQRESPQAATFPPPFSKN